MNRSAGLILKKAIVLLVEDNPDDELLAMRALKKANISCQVDVVRDGQEALDYLFAQGNFAERNIDDQPRVVFLDLNLPKINGIEVLKQVRSNDITRKLPVVLLTSSENTKDIEDGYTNGVNSYIKKPVDFTTFIEQIKLMGEYWLTVNRIPDHLSR
mgnify:CR=1 FL=1|jgi:CheY-like chemotaxis protein|tara:strand:- start:1419 stop:1889 length:471 start_codon:yes stop_codon:yes gene_type:complete